MVLPLCFMKSTLPPAASALDVKLFIRTPVAAAPIPSFAIRSNSSRRLIFLSKYAWTRSFFRSDMSCLRRTTV